jgi:Winged helix DNA-binding domain
MSYGEAGRALGVHPNRLRFAAATGTVLIRWEGARRPTVWTVPPPAVDPRDARLELARRYLHIYGPATPEAFGRWAGIGLRHGVAAFEALGRSLTPVRTPVGDAWILLHGRDRELLVPDAARRQSLWTPRVWPGGLLVGGQVVGTWRRADAIMTVQPWRRLSPAERDAVAAEAESLPLPGISRRIVVRWDD